MMKFSLDKRYQVQTSWSIEEMLELITARAIEQRDEKALVPLSPLDYREIKLYHNRFIIERWPNNPAGAIGTITFEMREAEGQTNIVCILTPYQRAYFTFHVVPTVILSGIFFLFFVSFFFFLYLFDNFHFSYILFIGVAALILGLIFYLRLRYNMGQLEIYSEMILRDLGILNKKERTPKIRYI